MNAPNTTSQSRSSTMQSKVAGKAPEPVPAPVMNLLDFDDTEPAPGAGANAPAATNKALPALASNGMLHCFLLISVMLMYIC